MVMWRRWCAFLLGIVPVAAWRFRAAAHGFKLRSSLPLLSLNREVATSAAAVDQVPTATRLKTLTEAILSRRAPVDYRCCMACEGTGRLFLRRRKPSAPVEGVAAPPPPETQCSICGGIGLLEREHTAARKQHAREPSQDSSERVDDALSGPTVAIVGGGIGGVALALALEQRGMRAVVYERDPSFFSRAQGYGLTLQQGSSAIAALGLTADAEAEGSRSTCHVAMNAKGSVIGRHGAAARTPRAADKDGSSGGDGGGGGTSAAAARRRNLHLPRQSLRALLCARLDRDTVRWNHRFDGCVVEADGRLNLSFNGGKLRTVADVLVGGDGIRSVVRRVLEDAIRTEDASMSDAASSTPPADDESPDDVEPTSSSGLRSLHTMVILGYSACEHELCASDRVFELVDGESRLYAMPFSPLPESTTMWQLSFPMPSAHGHALARAGGGALLAEALRRCGGWAAPLPELLGATCAADVTGYPVYDRAIGDRLSPAGAASSSAVSLRATLLGDAAHPMAPFKAQGANQAVIDAVELARALYDSELGDEAATANAQLSSAEENGVRRRRRRSGRDVSAAIAAYEASAAPRAVAKVEASRSAAALLHSPAALVVSEGALTRAAAARQAT